MTTIRSLHERAADFEPVADALRETILDHFGERGAPLSSPAGLTTLETNSGLAASRANVLLELLAADEPDLDFAGVPVADLGCGFGSLAVYLAFLGAQVTAVDVNTSRLAVGEVVARRFGLPARFVEGSFQELPLGDRQFSLALVNNAFCYVVPRPERLVGLAQVRRVLEPGGRLLMRNPTRTAARDPFTGLPGVNRLPARLAGSAAAAVGRRRSEVRLLSARSQAAELRRIGFEVIDITSARRRTIKPLDRWAASYQHVLARRPVTA